MTSTTARQLVDDNAAVLERFVMNYLLDRGFTMQLVEAVAMHLYGQAVVVDTKAETPLPLSMISETINDIVDIDVFSGTTFDLDRVVNGAVSLEFLVRYARKINPAVMPPEFIPSDEVVKAALEIFHANRAEIDA